MRDLAAQELLVALQGSDHDVCIAAAERHDVDGRKLEVRRHPHLGHCDDVALEFRIMHAALGKNVRDRVTHGFTDAQLTLRAAGGGVLLVVAGHWGLSKSSCPRLSRASTSFLLNQLTRGWPGQARP